MYLCVVSSVSSFSLLSSVSVFVFIVEEVFESMSAFKVCQVCVEFVPVEMLLGVGQKLSPRESSDFPSLVRSAVARLITVSVSRCLGSCLLFLVSLRV